MGGSRTPGGCDQDGLLDGAFYQPLGEGRYRSTAHTAGPWNAESQHLGPPGALLIRALERMPADGPFVIARVTVELLGPVPVAELEVRAAVERPGRSVELLSADLRAGERVVAQARAWRMARSDTGEVSAGLAEPLPPPESGRPAGRPEGWGPGYLDAMEWRNLRGGLAEPGPATVWARQRLNLVAGETPTGLQRLLVVADSGSGISARLDPRHWWFINTELTVHIYREPTGEWIGLAADTVIGPHGVGTALSTVYDQSGPVAAGVQALLVRPR